MTEASTDLFKKLEERFPGAVHRLGNNTDEWAKKARLDWEIKESDVAYTTDGKKVSLFPGRRVFFRSDTEDPLAIVGAKFKAVQPKDILDFYGEIADRYGFKLAVAGEIAMGKKIWAMAETPHSFSLTKGDELKGGLFVMTGCDGSLSTQGFFTSFRLWCLNQLPVIDRHARKGRKLQVFKCTHGSAFSSKRVEHDLELMAENWDSLKKAAGALSDKNVTEKQAVDFFQKVFMAVPEGEVLMSVGEIEDLKDNVTIKRLLTTYRKGEGQQSIHGTAWGVVNAVTNYLDHGQKSKDPAVRIRKGWIDGAKKKTTVMESALMTFAPKFALSSKAR